VIFFHRKLPDQVVCDVRFCSVIMVKRKTGGFNGLIRCKERNVSGFVAAPDGFSKGILFYRTGRSTLDEVVLICFRFSDDTGLNERFQGLGPVIPQPKPEILGFCIRKVNCTTGVKGILPLKISYDKGRCAPYPVGNSISG